ncbi:MAG: hypothetical protein FWF22_00045 [Treponema sp.]|nr:hypothetical protein [Treponema sp.]
MIDVKDKNRLRELAQKQLEFTKSPQMEKICAKWQALAQGRCTEPVVRMSFGAYRDEIIYPRMICRGEFAKKIEETLLANMAGRELFDDDSVVADYFQFFWHTHFNLWNIETKKTFLSGPNDKKLAFHIEPVVGNLHEDFHLFSKSTYGVNKNKTLEEMEELQNCIGDILPVKISMPCLHGNITNKLVQLMGMENMYMSIMDYPDEFHAVMRMACEDYKEYYNWLAGEKLLCPTTNMQPLGQDTYCYTDKLPSVTVNSPKDVWGYMDSQESAAMSPDMYGEFIFPYLSRGASNFGLLSYGCCEPVHPVWEKYLSTLPNLGRVSVSAWCDEEFMGERLRGCGIVFHRKPKATFLGLNKTLDEDEIAEYFKKTALAARGCILEITQREVTTIYGNTDRIKQYIGMIKKTINKYWQP